MKNSTTYRNPVVPGFYPDPSICRAGEDYFLVNSSFEYFPGIPIFHSRDLIHWRQIGHCLTRPEQLPLGEAECSRGIYAATIRHHNGRFYVITTLVVPGGGHFFVWTDDPAGEWSDPIWVDHPGIDPSLFFDDDGTVYFQCTYNDQEGTITQGQIDLDTGALGTMKTLWCGTGGQYAEAPHMYRIGNMYYLMLAEGGTEYGHMETIARSASVWGPFEADPDNPVLTHRSSPNPIQATGHADMIQANDGSWWMVFLGIRSVWGRYHHLGRETFLTPVWWTEDGWPRVGKNRQSALEVEAHCLPSKPVEVPPERDDFDSEKLGMQWNFIRNPSYASWSLTERVGYLRLYGQTTTLDEQASPTFVGRRQQHMHCLVSCALSFVPENETQEAGLTVLASKDHHYEIYVTRTVTGLRMRVRQRIGRLSCIMVDHAVDEGAEQLLQIEADEFLYRFYRVTEAGRIFLCDADVRYLSSEVVGGFTGVFIGMYAQAGSENNVPPADFDWFDYKGNCAQR